MNAAAQNPTADNKRNLLDRVLTIGEGVASAGAAAEKLGGLIEAVKNWAG